MEKTTVSELRKTPHTQSQAPHPVLMTLKYDVEQVKLLIQLGMDSGISICTRVDIITPNGLHGSEDFALSPEQIKKVWQERPKVIQLHLKSPINLIQYLPEIIAHVGVEGLLIDQIKADCYLSIVQKKTDLSNINPTETPEKIHSFRQDAISKAVFTHILPKILPDSSQRFVKSMYWECFLELKEALMLDGAKNLNIDECTNKENSTVSGIDHHQGDIYTTYKAFRERLKNLVTIYKNCSSS